ARLDPRRRSRGSPGWWGRNALRARKGRHREHHGHEQSDEPERSHLTNKTSTAWHLFPHTWARVSPQGQRKEATKTMVAPTWSFEGQYFGGSRRESRAQPLVSPSRPVRSQRRNGKRLTPQRSSSSPQRPCGRTSMARTATAPSRMRYQAP